jgi:hypothetical protein
MNRHIALYVNDYTVDLGVKVGARSRSILNEPGRTGPGDRGSALSRVEAISTEL